MTPIPGVSRRGRERPPAADGGLLAKAPAKARHEAASRPPRRRRRWLFNGARPEPVPSHIGPVEEPDAGKVGICCSGGGIRSAAFSLGALQALQKEGELRRASYLAAVSGGSYIAAAISTVARVGPQDADGEKPRDSDPELLSAMGSFAPCSPEEQYLRNRCSYLAPTLTDRLYLGMRVVLGLLVNLAFISLPLVGFALLVTGILYASQLPDLAGRCQESKCAASLPTWFWIVSATPLGAGAAFGFATLLFRWRAERWERFFAIWATRLLIAAAVLAVLLVGLPYLVDWLDRLADDGASLRPSVLDALGSIGAGFLALLTGVIAQLARLLTSEKGMEGAGRVKSALGKLGSGTGIALAYAAGGLIGPLLLLAVVALTIAVGMSQVERGGGVDESLVGIGAGIVAVFAVLYWLVDLTTWSLHPYYKRRLSSVFALKRVRRPALDEEERKRVEALEPSDPERDAGIAIERDFDELVPLSRTALTEEQTERAWPTLLVCAAANVSDPGATPPGRAVTSFTFSARAVGGPLVGAVEMSRLERAFENDEEADATEETRRTRPGKVAKRVEAFVKAGARKHRRRDLTLPAAVAMSGAAISPSMGKMTKRPLTFLMALANVRLGVWVPNPRWVAEVDESQSLPRRYARPRPWYLLCELLGRNRIDARYLYVTDGGHYENLGLVELLRRGCTEVYCLDASGIGAGGVEFAALGEAIALARSELGAEIEFDAEQPDEMVPDEGSGEKPDPGEKTPDKKSKLAKRDVVTGKITYPKGPDGKALTGRLVYVRNAMTAKAPWDVRAHSETDPRFPNNPTIDQLYTDQKFEAYRVLGARAGASAVAAMKASWQDRWRWRC